MNQVLNERAASSADDVDPARQVQPLSDELPTSLTEAIALLDESRIQCIELKIMLDATEKFVAGAEDRDRNAQAALAEMRAALDSSQASLEREREARAQLDAELAQLRASSTEARKQLAGFETERTELRRQAQQQRNETEQLRSVMRAQQAQMEELRRAGADSDKGDAELREQLEAERRVNEHLHTELQTQAAQYEQLRAAAATSGSAPVELIEQLEAERRTSERLRAELEEERRAYEELNHRIQDERNAWNRQRVSGDLDTESQHERLVEQIEELQKLLQETNEKHELAIAAQLREIQRCTEGERNANAKLKALEQELSILQARAAMLAARNDPEQDRPRADEKSGLVGRFVGRFRGRSASA